MSVFVNFSSLKGTSQIQSIQISSWHACILIEISMKIRIAKFLKAINESGVNSASVDFFSDRNSVTICLFKKRILTTSCTSDIKFFLLAQGGSMNSSIILIGIPLGRAAGFAYLPFSKI